MLADILRAYQSGPGAGLCVIEEATRRIIYADALAKRFLGAEAEGRRCYETICGQNSPCAGCPQLTEGVAYEWEMLRSGEHSRMLKLRYWSYGGKQGRYRVCQIMDIGDYMGLSSDIISYMLLFKQLAVFQTNVMEHLGDSFPELLTIIKRHFAADRLLLLLRRSDGRIQSYLFGPGERRGEPSCPAGAFAALCAMDGDPELNTDRLPPALLELLTADGNRPGAQATLFCGELNDETYALLMTNTGAEDEPKRLDATLLNVVRMYIENGILRDNIIRDGELDRLTGLYNHSKFLACMEAEFKGGAGFGVLYFDLNDLKYINDNMGHEAGDALLRQAAAAIRAIAKEPRLRAFRIGGDEFVAIAEQSSEEELTGLLQAWKEASRALQEHSNLPCVVAAGWALGRSGESAKQVIDRADAAMYLDKKNMKAAGR